MSLNHMPKAFLTLAIQIVEHQFFQTNHYDVGPISQFLPPFSFSRWSILPSGTDSMFTVLRAIGKNSDWAVRGSDQKKGALQ